MGFRALGLSPATVVANGAIDAHLGALGAGIEPGTLVKIIGTSTCDLSGPRRCRKTYRTSPAFAGLFPGQFFRMRLDWRRVNPAVGDIFNTGSRRRSRRAGNRMNRFQGIAAAPGSRAIRDLSPLDWHNGNRTVLIDQRLTGMIVGLTLHSTPAEIYRALIEATAFGARIIVERFEAYGIAVTRGW